MFWVVFGTVSLGAAGYFGSRYPRPRVALLAVRMSSHDPAQGADAFNELERYYRSKWAAFDPTIDLIGDRRRIHFEIHREQSKFYAVPSRLDRDEETCCRTVGQAVAAIAHNEGRYRTAYQGDWDRWWMDNKGYYGRAEPFGENFGADAP